MKQRPGTRGRLKTRLRIEEESNNKDEKGERERLVKGQSKRSESPAQ